uniref:Predicted protein n=1 Tax=Hordeum vulgare subsp. vulgare TaxID=112509 RepID=F2CQD7_HORVV|nr:predicted protein [Hordeum vulgare subsp. vulgare]BAJ87349.1 predicted protein [Hordeum vulgare subsp. vulgare]
MFILLTSGSLAAAASPVKFVAVVPVHASLLLLHPLAASRSFPLHRKCRGPLSAKPSRRPTPPSAKACGTGASRHSCAPGDHRVDSEDLFDPSPRLRAREL